MKKRTFTEENYFGKEVNMFTETRFWTGLYEPIILVSRITEMLHFYN
jgi:hypothetical protein